PRLSLLASLAGIEPLSRVSALCLAFDVFSLHWLMHVSHHRMLFRSPFRGTVWADDDGSFRTQWCTKARHRVNLRRRFKMKHPFETRIRSARSSGLPRAAALG